MRYIIPQVIEFLFPPPETPTTQARLVVRGGGVLALEVFVAGTWQGLVDVSSDGDVARAAAQPPGFRRGVEP